MAYNTAGRASRHPSRILLALNHFAFSILVVAADQHDPVHERPDAAAADGEQLCDADTGFTAVEAVETQVAEEPAEQEGGQPALFAYIGIERIGLLGGRAAVGAHDGVVGDLFTALITEHNGEILIKMPTLMRIFGFLRMPVRVNSYKFKKKIPPPLQIFREKFRLFRKIPQAMYLRVSRGGGHVMTAQSMFPA